MIEEYIYSILAADENLAEYTSTIRPSHVSQSDSLPYVTYQFVSESTNTTLDGLNTLRERTLEVQIFASSYFEALTITEIVREILTDYIGYMEYGEEIQHIRFMNDSEIINLNDIETLTIYGRQLEFEVAYYE